MATIQNGKGDKPRPTNKKVWDTNYQAIKWKSKKEVVPKK